MKLAPKPCSVWILRQVYAGEEFAASQLRIPLIKEIWIKEIFAAPHPGGGGPYFNPRTIYHDLQYV
jgi:hypothetical protein